MKKLLPIFLGIVVLALGATASSDDILKMQEGTNIDIQITESAGTSTLIISSTDTDEKVKVSSDDTTPGFLNGKLVGGSGITLTEGNGGGDETLSISANDKLTTKGDILTHDGTSDVRIGVGADGQVLVADSNETTGVRWANPQSSGGASNLIINGNLEVNQENNTNPADDEYTVGDLYNYLGEAPATVTRAAGGPTGSNYFMNVRVDTANSQAGIVYFLSNADIQNIVQNGFASFSFAAKTTSGSAISNLHAVLLSWTGTADTLTSDVIGTWGQDGTNPTFATNFTAEFTAVNLALTTSWQVFTTESIAVDTSGVKNLALVIWTDDGTIAANDEFQLAQFNLNRGQNVQAFSTPLLATVQNQVYYYVERIGGDGNEFPVMAQVLSTSVADSPVRFNTKKRIAPSMSFYGTNSNIKLGSATGQDISSNADRTFHQATKGSVRVRYSTASGLVAGSASQLHFQTANEYFLADARL